METGPATTLPQDNRLGLPQDNRMQLRGFREGLHHVQVVVALDTGTEHDGEIGRWVAATVHPDGGQCPGAWGQRPRITRRARANGPCPDGYLWLAELTYRRLPR